MYNDNIEVVTLASHLMLFAALYQLSDSVQVGSGYYGVIKILALSFYCTFIAYWVIGLPSDISWDERIILLAMGPAGFWMVLF